jgi:hypothetical protein
VKSEGSFRLQLQSVLHGSGSSFASAAGNRWIAVRSSIRNNESGDGIARPRMSQLRRLDFQPPQFLPWLEDASVHHAKGLAVFGLMSL